MEITAELEHYHGVCARVYGEMVVVYIITIHMHAGRQAGRQAGRHLCVCVYTSSWIL
jgi:hypothetical protein